MEAGGRCEDAQVLVMGGSDAEIRRHLHDIMETHQASMKQGSSRGFNGDMKAFYGSDKRQGVLQRLGPGPKDARPILWKVFYTGSSCNLMSEIWIEDKSNPEVKAGNLSKAYVILHVHHHTTQPVGSAQDLQDLVQPEAWHASNLLVDAANARHLLGHTTNTRSPCQFDNPFYEQHDGADYPTAIEPSGKSTLKLFPESEFWACDCSEQNLMHREQCSSRAHQRPCSRWNWEIAGERNSGLAKLLKQAHERAVTWLGGGPKDTLLRGGGVGGGGAQGDCRVRTLADVRRLDSMSFGRAMGLFVGIDEYEDRGVPDLRHCKADARSMAEGLKEAAGNASSWKDGIVVMCEGANEKALKKSVGGFMKRACDAVREPGGARFLLLYFAGHGTHVQRTDDVQGGDHVLASDYDPDDPFGVGMWRVQEMIKVFGKEALDGIEKYFVFDCCREASPGVGGADGNHASSDSFGHELMALTDSLPANTLVVFATKAGGTVDDGSIDEKHGSLCRALLEDDSSPSSGGIFTSGERFYNLLSDACLRYSERRKKEGKGRAVMISGGIRGKIALDELREQADRALCAALTQDAKRCSKVTARGTGDVQSILSAEAAGNCIPCPPREGPLHFSSDGDGEKLPPSDDDYSYENVGVFVPEREPSESDRARCKVFESAVLSGASTCASSDDEEGEMSAEVLAKNQLDVKQATKVVGQLNALVARMVDNEAALDEFWGDAEGLVGKLQAALDDKVRGKLRSSGVVCDKRMLRALEPQVQRELPAPDREELAQMSLSHAKASAEMLRQVQEGAKSGYLRMKYVADTGSFTASLRAPGWLIPILRALLEGHGGFRREVWDLGFRKFGLGGVIVVLQERVVGEGGKLRVEALRHVHESMYTQAGEDQASCGVHRIGLLCSDMDTKNGTDDEQEASPAEEAICGDLRSGSPAPGRPGDLAHRGMDSEGVIRLPVSVAQPDYESLKGSEPVIAIFIGRDASDVDDYDLNVGLNGLCERVKEVHLMPRLFYHWSELPSVEDDFVPRELGDKEMYQYLSFALDHVQSLCDQEVLPNDTESIMSMIKHGAHDGYSKLPSTTKRRLDLYCPDDESTCSIITFKTLDNQDDRSDILLSGQGSRGSSIFLGAFRVFDSQPQKEPSNFRGLLFIVRADDGFLEELDGLRKAKVREQEDQKPPETLKVSILVLVKDSNDDVPNNKDLVRFLIDDSEPIRVHNVLEDLDRKIRDGLSEQCQERTISDGPEAIVVEKVDEMDLNLPLDNFSLNLNNWVSGNEDAVRLTVIVKVGPLPKCLESPEDEGDETETSFTWPLDDSSSRISKEQQSVANRLLHRTELILKEDFYGRFKDVHFIVLVPTFNTLRDQTQIRIMTDVQHFGFQELSKTDQKQEMKRRVLSYQLKKNKDMPEEWKEFKKNCLEKSQDLFVIVADECHWGINKGGAHDKLINDADLNGRDNFLVLLVSATPYNVLTSQSRISDKTRTFDNLPEALHEVEWFRPGERQSSAYRGLEWYLSTVPTELRHVLPSKMLNPQSDWKLPLGMIREDAALSRTLQKPRGGQAVCTESAILVDYAFSMAFFSICTPAQHAGANPVLHISPGEVTVDKAKDILMAFQDLRDNLEDGLSGVTRYIKIADRGSNSRRDKVESIFREMITDMKRVFDQRLKDLGQDPDSRPRTLRNIYVQGQSDGRPTFGETDWIVGDLLDQKTGNMKIMRVFTNSGGLLCGHFLRYARDRLFKKKERQRFCQGRDLDLLIKKGVVKDLPELPPFAVIEDFGSDKLFTGFAKDPDFKRFVLHPERLETIGELRSRLSLKSGDEPQRELRYEDLDGFPCIVILVEKGRMGDTFPPSLDCLDLRMRASKNLSTFVQEIGRLCRYPKTLPCKSGNLCITALTNKEKERAVQNLHDLEHLKDIITFSSIAENQPFHCGAQELSFKELEEELLDQPGDVLAVMRCAQDAQSRNGEIGVRIREQEFAGFASHVEPWECAGKQPWEAGKQPVPEVVFSGKGTLMSSSDGIYSLELETVDAVESSDFELVEGDVVSIRCEPPLAFSITETVTGLKINQAAISLPPSDLAKILHKTSACFIFRDSASLKVLMRSKCKHGGSVHKVAHKLPYALVPRKTMADVRECVTAYDDMLKSGTTPHPKLSIWKQLKTGTLDQYVLCGNRSDYHAYRQHSPAWATKQTTNYDHGNSTPHERRLLLSAECQIGKTGVYCAFLSKLMKRALENRSDEERVVFKISGDAPPDIKWALPYWEDIQKGFDDWKKNCFRPLTVGKYHRRLRFVRLECLFKACLRAAWPGCEADTQALSDTPPDSWADRYQKLLKENDAVSSDVKIELLDKRTEELRKKEPPVEVKRISKFLCRVQVKDRELVREAIDWDVTSSKKFPSDKATVFWAKCGASDDPLHFLEYRIQRMEGHEDYYTWTRSIEPERMHDLCWEQDITDEAKGGKAGASSSTRPAGDTSREHSITLNHELAAKAYSQTNKATVNISMPRQKPRVVAIKSDHKCGSRIVRFCNVGGAPDDRAVELTIPAKYANLFSDCENGGLVDSAKALPWIFTPSYRRHGQTDSTLPALLDRNAVLDNHQEIKCVQVLAVRQHDEKGRPELEAYQDACGLDYVLLKLPDVIKIEDEKGPQQCRVSKGIGFARLTCQLVAHVLKLDKIWMVDDNVQYCNALDIDGGFRPCSFLDVIASIEKQVLGAGSDVNVPVSFHGQGQEVPRQLTISREVHAFNQSRKAVQDMLKACKMFDLSDEHKRYAETDSDKEEVKSRDEFSGKLCNRFGVIGMLRDPRQRRPIEVDASKPFSVTHSVYSFFLLNVRATVEAGALYPAISFWEDIEFNQICREKGLVALKCNTFFHRKKDLQPRTLLKTSLGQSSAVLPELPVIEMRRVGSLLSNGTEECVRFKRAGKGDDEPEPRLTQEEYFGVLESWVAEFIEKDDVGMILPFPTTDKDLDTLAQAVDTDDDVMDGADKFWHKRMTEWCEKEWCQANYESASAETCLKEKKKLVIFCRKNFHHTEANVLNDFLGHLSNYIALRKGRQVSEASIDVIFPLRLFRSVDDELEDTKVEPFQVLNEGWNKFAKTMMGNRGYDVSCDLFTPMLAQSCATEILIRPTLEHDSDPSMLVLRIVLKRKSSSQSPAGTSSGLGHELDDSNDSMEVSSSSALPSMLPPKSEKKRKHSDPENGSLLTSSREDSDQVLSDPAANGEEMEGVEVVSTDPSFFPSQAGIPDHKNDKDGYLAYAFEKLISSDREFGGRNEKKFDLVDLVRACREKESVAFSRPVAMVGKPDVSALDIVKELCACRPEQCKNAKDLLDWISGKKNVFYQCWLHEMVCQVRKDLSLAKPPKQTPIPTLSQMLWHGLDKIPKVPRSVSPHKVSPLPSAEGGANKGGQTKSDHFQAQQAGRTKGGSSSQPSAKEGGGASDLQQKRPIEDVTGGLAGQTKYKTIRNEKSSGADQPAEVGASSEGSEATQASHVPNSERGGGRTGGLGEVGKSKEETAGGECSASDSKGDGIASSDGKSAIKDERGDGLASESKRPSRNKPAPIVRSELFSQLVGGGGGTGTQDPHTPSSTQDSLSQSSSQASAAKEGGKRKRASADEEGRVDGPGDASGASNRPKTAAAAAPAAPQKSPTEAQVRAAIQMDELMCRSKLFASFSIKRLPKEEQEKFSAIVTAVSVPTKKVIEDGPYKGQKVITERVVKGKCGRCGYDVWSDSARTRDRLGNYSHKDCPTEPARGGGGGDDAVGGGAGGGGGSQARLVIDVSDE